MQEKFEFDNLTKDLQHKTAQNLSTRDLVNLAQTSKYHLALFKPMVDAARKLSLTFLHLVPRGEHGAVKAMLDKDMSLIFKRGFVRDCSGREFENISAFEYALWAMDKHMWAAMIGCIPKNEEGRKIFPQLIAQYNKVTTTGVTYRLNGQTITEKHFDFENTIIKALSTQSSAIHNSEVKNWLAINKQWREDVGGAQMLLPMHVVDEYCSDEPFILGQEFVSQPKSSKQFSNWTTDKKENWFDVDSKLSVDFAIYKSPRGAVGREESGQGWSALLDAVAMRTLLQERTRDVIALKSQLEDQMTLDNHYQVSQI